MTDQQTPVVSVLTDGSGISKLTASKTFKDFVADVLLSGAAALATVQILGLQDAVAQPDIAAFAIAGAVIRSVYRMVLRWATT